MEKKRRTKVKMSSGQMIPLGFALIILIGAALLLLPVASADGHSAGPLTALFTSTTSVCVTGLVVVDTFSYWSLFGKIVILLLIQIGGMGVVMITSLFMAIIGQKISIRDRALIKDSFNLNSMSGIVGFLKKVAKGIFIVEGAGAVLYSIRFIPMFGFIKGLWKAVFTSVSAFCNAGIDVLGPDSLVPFWDDPLVLLTTMFLIFFGGLGFIVWFDLSDTLKKTGRKKGSLYGYFRRLNEHTKLVLTLTVFLILFGAAVVFLIEKDNDATLGKMPLGYKILNSFFQSVTLRTAGFSTVPQGNLREVTAFISCLFM
ncbi:MAG: potassium transporter TrkH, partial [Clostridiales bacterium]|nr:potassium transporter TrkH [Clostridiales bacterium]